MFFDLEFRTCISKVSGTLLPDLGQNICSDYFMPGLMGFRLNSTMGGRNELCALSMGHKATGKTGSPVSGDQNNTSSSHI